MPTPRLVVIDDDPLLATVIVNIARDAYPDARDLVTECIRTPEAAMLAIQRATAEPEITLIVVSDFNLPPSSLTGLDILAEVKAKLPGAKRVLMTGGDPLEISDRLLAAELEAFVPKPFQFDEMRALIVWLVEEIARTGRAEAALRIPVATSVPDGGSIVLLRSAVQADERA